jgi:hypothetical protein
LPVDFIWGYGVAAWALQFPKRHMIFLIKFLEVVEANQNIIKKRHRSYTAERATIWIILGYGNTCIIDAVLKLNWTPN